MGEDQQDWKRSSSVFATVYPALRVKLSDGTPIIQVLSGTVPPIRNALFLTAAQVSVLRDIHTTLAGPSWQPEVGVTALWRRFIFVERSMSASLVLASPPVIQEITILNPQRTRAIAPVSIRHEGCTVILEKDEHGTWRAVGLTNQWIA
jgi:hypothetical protein